tara:strand:- start:3305 stop:3925 length:621 start_codon:yes stop_codon:yes gene_type:complete
MDHITTTTISGTSTNTVEWSNLDTATYSSYYVTWEVQANASGLTNQELAGGLHIKTGYVEPSNGITYYVLGSGNTVKTNIGSDSGYSYITSSATSTNYFCGAGGFNLPYDSSGNKQYWGQGFMWIPFGGDDGDPDGDTCAPAYIGRSAAVDQAETSNYGYGMTDNVLIAGHSYRLAGLQFSTTAGGNTIAFAPGSRFSLFGLKDSA